MDMRRQDNGKTRYLYDKQSMAMHKVRQRKMKSKKEGVHCNCGWLRVHVSNAVIS